MVTALISILTMYSIGLAHDPARAQDLATVDETENPPDLSRESVNAVRDEKENNVKEKDAKGKEKKESVKENANGSGNVESKNEEESENERGSVKGKEREGNENIRKGNGERKKRKRGSKRNEENEKSTSLQANLHHLKVLQIQT